jgi:hypothetical protein
MKGTNMKIITRKEAMQQGLVRYYTGIRCAKGHTSERYTSQGMCIECNKKGHNIYRTTDKGKAAIRRTTHKYLYGLSPTDFDDMLKAQQGQCAICRKPFDQHDRNRQPDVDHCHDTGEVRGLLCWKCNTGIGKFHHDVTILENAIKYLNIFK